MIECYWDPMMMRMTVLTIILARVMCMMMMELAVAARPNTYTHAHACTCTHTHIHAQTHTRAHSQTCINVRAHARAHAHKQTYRCRCTRADIRHVYNTSLASSLEVPTPTHLLSVSDRLFRSSFGSVFCATIVTEHSHASNCWHRAQPTGRRRPWGYCYRA